MCSREDDPSEIGNVNDPNWPGFEDINSRTVAERWHNQCLALYRLRGGVFLFCDLPHDHDGRHRDQTTEAPLVWGWGRDHAHPVQQAHRGAHV